MSNKYSTITLRILPYCNHPQYKDGCTYCENAQLVYEKILKKYGSPYITNTMRTIVDVKSATNIKDI